MPPVQPGQVRLREGTGKMPQPEISPVQQVPRAPSGAQVRQGELTRRRREFGWWSELQEAAGKATKKRRRYRVSRSRTRAGQKAQGTAYREPSVPKGGSDGPTASSASKPPRPKNQVEVKSHITVEYGCWSCKGEDINVGKPIALILFLRKIPAGRPTQPAGEPGLDRVLRRHGSTHQNQPPGRWDLGKDTGRHPLGDV